jgi:hypothetical protein
VENLGFNLNNYTNLQVIRSSSSNSNSSNSSERSDSPEPILSNTEEKMIRIIRGSFSDKVEETSEHSDSSEPVSSNSSERSNSPQPRHERLSGIPEEIRKIGIGLKIDLQQTSKLEDDEFNATTEFEISCIMGDTLKVKKLLNEYRKNHSWSASLPPHASISPAQNYNSPIFCACGAGNEDIVELLLADHEVNPSAGDNRALKAACQNGYTKIVKMLLEYKDPFPEGQRVIIQQPDLIPVSHAMHPQSYGYGFPPHKLSPGERVLIGRIVYIFMGYEMIESRIFKAINVNSENNAPLRLAMESGHVEIVELLLNDSRTEYAELVDHLLKFAELNNNATIPNIIKIRNESKLLVDINKERANKKSVEDAEENTEEEEKFIRIIRETEEDKGVEILNDSSGKQEEVKEEKLVKNEGIEKKSEFLIESFRAVLNKTRTKIVELVSDKGTQKFVPKKELLLLCHAAWKNDDKELVTLIIDQVIENGSPSDEFHKFFIELCAKGSFQLIKKFLSNASLNPSFADNAAIKAAFRNDHKLVVDLLLKDKRFVLTEECISLLKLDVVYN